MTNGTHTSSTGPYQHPVPDLAIPPGEYLAEVLAEKQLSPSQLAKQWALPVQSISQLIKGRTSIDQDIALRLEQTLAIPAELWLALEQDYRQSQAKSIEVEQRYRRKLVHTILKK